MNKWFVILELVRDHRIANICLPYIMTCGIICWECLQKSTLSF
jgi:hypothetical protein